MIIKDKLFVGLLIVLIVSTGIYITMPSEDVKIRVTEDFTNFYIKEGGRWVISGVEYNSLWDGTTKMNRIRDSLSVDIFVDNQSNTTLITRSTTYIRGPKIIDTYFFDGTEIDVKKFPISHQVTIINGSEYIYQYEVRRLVYDGLTIKNVDSPQSFGRRMKIEWQDGDYWNTVYKSGIMKVRYRPTSDYETYSVRLFDPNAVPVVTSVYLQPSIIRFNDTGVEAWITGTDSDSSSLNVSANWYVNGVNTYNSSRLVYEPANRTNYLVNTPITLTLDYTTNSVVDTYFDEDASITGTETGLIADALDGGGEIAFIRFDTSSVPINSYIVSANLVFRLANAGRNESLQLWYSDNQTWDWNTVDSLCVNVYCDNLTRFFTTNTGIFNGNDTGVPGDLDIIDITSIMKLSYAAGNDWTSIVLNNTGDPTKSYVWYQNDSSTPSNRPYLNVTYAPMISGAPISLYNNYGDYDLVFSWTSIFNNTLVNDATFTLTGPTDFYTYAYFVVTYDDDTSWDSRTIFKKNGTETFQVTHLNPTFNVTQVDLYGYTDGSKAFGNVSFDSMNLSTLYQNKLPYDSYNSTAPGIICGTLPITEYSALDNIIASCYIDDGVDNSTLLNSSVSSATYYIPYTSSSVWNDTVVDSSDSLALECTGGSGTTAITWDYKFFVNGSLNTTVSNSTSYASNVTVTFPLGESLSGGDVWVGSCRSINVTNQSFWVNTSSVAVGQDFGSSSTTYQDGVASNRTYEYDTTLNLSVSCFTELDNVTVYGGLDGGSGQTKSCTGANGNTTFLINVTDHYDNLNAGVIRNFPFSGLCYQETATTATACGGLDNGSYFEDNDVVNPENWNDGVWDENYSTTRYVVLGPDRDSVYVNYSIPTNAVNSSVFMMRGYKFASTYEDRNLSVAGCWNYSETNGMNLQLRMGQYVNSTSGLYFFEAHCYNGTWLKILNHGSWNKEFNTVYEEAMWWNISASSSGLYTINWSYPSYYNVTGLTLIASAVSENNLTDITLEVNGVDNKVLKGDLVGTELHTRTFSDGLSSKSLFFTDTSRTQTVFFDVGTSPFIVLNYTMNSYPADPEPLDYYYIFNNDSDIDADNTTGTYSDFTIDDLESNKGGWYTSGDLDINQYQSDNDRWYLYSTTNTDECGSNCESRDEGYVINSRTNINDYDRVGFSVTSSSSGSQDPSCFADKGATSTWVGVTSDTSDNDPFVAALFSSCSTFTSGYSCNGDSVSGTVYLERVAKDSTSWKVYQGTTYVKTITIPTGEQYVSGKMDTYSSRRACGYGSSTGDFSFTELYVGGVGTSALGNNTYNTSFNATSEVIHNTSQNITAAYFEATEYSDDVFSSITYFLSPDNGSTWEETDNPSYHLFSAGGKYLRWKAVGTSTSTSGAFGVNVVDIDISTSNPENLTFDLGADDTIDYTYNGVFNVSDNVSITDGTGHITYVESNCPNSDNCVVPLEITSDANGGLIFSSIKYIIDTNPIRLNGDLPETGNITFSSSEIPNIAGFINYSYSLLFYVGDKDNFPIYVDYLYQNESTETKNVSVDIRYSPYNLSKVTEFADFIPLTFIQYNISPYGQSSTTPYWNFTGISENHTTALYMNLNETLGACLTLRASNTSDQSGLNVELTDTGQNIINLTAGESKGVWAYLDYVSCTVGYPIDFIINPLCTDCVITKDFDEWSGVY